MARRGDTKPLCHVAQMIVALSGVNLWPLSGGKSLNRLRVFKIANTARLGRGVGQERWLRMGPSENYAAR